MSSARAFAIGADDENRARGFDFRRGLSALLGREPLEVLRRTAHRLFGLAPGDDHAGLLMDGRDHLSKGLFGRRLRQPLLQGVGRVLRRQIQLGVERMQALKGAPAIALTADADRAKDGFERACLKTLMSVRMSGRINDRL